MVTRYSAGSRDDLRISDKGELVEYADYEELQRIYEDLRAIYNKTLDRYDDACQQIGNRDREIRRLRYELGDLETRCRR